MTSDVLSDASTSPAMQEMQNWYLENFPDDYREADGSIWKPLRRAMGKIEQVRKTLDNPPTHAHILKIFLQGVALHASRNACLQELILNGGDMIYDIFHTGNPRGMDSGTTLGGFKGRSFDAVALNTNWDGHFYYRAGVVWKKWQELTEGQRMRLRMEFPDLTPKEVK
jgi:hypothetical protein